jgi:hypothetical protein
MAVWVLLTLSTGRAAAGPSWHGGYVESARLERETLGPATAEVTL